MIRNLFFILLVNIVTQPWLSKGQTTCVCDLTSPSCDVNCCCDPDCIVNGNDTLTFSTCLDTGAPTNTLQCVYDQVVFVNNLPITTQVNQDGLFCIQRDSFSERNFYIQPACLAADTCFNQVSNAFTFQQTPPPALVFESFYRSGDPIYVVYSTGETGFLNVPMSGLSNRCQYSPIKYLMSTDTSCTWSGTNSTSICSENPALQCVNFTSSFKVAPSPAIFQEAVNLSNPFDHSGLITITSLSNCSNSVTCSQLVSPVILTFNTSGTNGILSVAATQTQEINPGSTLFAQSYIVEFVDSNTVLPLEQKSGNPGYLVGFPLISVKSNNTLADVVANANPNVGITVMQPSTAGCANVGDTPILFGKDVHVGCRLEFNNSIDCQVLQQEIYSALDRSNFILGHLFVGSFGNSSRTNLDPSQWTEILKPTQTVPPSATISCTNLVTGGQFQFLYANNGDIANPQPQIIGASYTYNNPQSLELVCFNPTCSNTQFVEVSMSVSFADVSETPVSVLQAPPSVQLTLPSDFFFPFKSSAKIPSTNMLWQIVFVFLSCLLSCS